jgi:hypothetical protein
VSRLRRGNARLQRGQCKTLAALFFCCTLMTSWPGHLPPVKEQRFWREAGPLRSSPRRCCSRCRGWCGIMTFRERVEALPIRPIAHISHGANPSLKIRLLPNAGTDRNVRSFEYLAAPAVDQCIVRQCSSFLLSSNWFFTSQLVPFISRPDSRQVAFKNRTLPPCTFYGSGETKFPDKVYAEHCLVLLVRDCVFVQMG